MASFTLRREVKASPEVVFEVMTDHGAYADFTPMRKTELEREGEPAPNGVGAIRIFRSIGPPLREEVLTYEPSSRYSYTMLSGAPLRDHVGTVELTPNGEGTSVVYAIRTTPTLPLIGPVVVAVVKRVVTQLLNGIASESERRAAAG